MAGFLSFTHVAACQIACPPIADVCPEAPTQPVTRPSRSVATMLIDIYMDGFSLHWRSAPLRHTVNYRVGPFIWVPEQSERTRVVNGLKFSLLALGSQHTAYSGSFTLWNSHRMTALGNRATYPPV